MSEPKDGRSEAIADIARFAMCLAAPRCVRSARAASSPTVPQVALLLIVDDAPEVRPLDLADALGVRPTVLAGMLKDLEDQGAISRDRLPENRRIRPIVLTGRGRALAAAALRRVAGALSGAGDAELHQIAHGLRTLLDSPARKSMPRRRPGALMPIEERILAQLRDGPSHGMAVADAIGVPSRTVYYALGRLEDAGHVKSARETVPKERPRRVYRLTPKGRRAI